MKRSKSPTHSIVRIPVRRGSLGKYRSRSPTKIRRRELSRVARKEGSGPVIRKLNVLSIFNKHRSPSLATKFRRDMHWVQSQRDLGKFH